MLDRPQGGERAILVQMALPGVDLEQSLAEFKELALSAQAEVLACVQGSRTAPDAKYFIGLGKAQALQAQVSELGAELVLVNHELSPSQERNLERLLQCRVVGRSGLILDIFAQRARTFEGKLQVELAQLQHLSTRLIRGWTHLERQKGGIGLRGPGETQLETDRRLLKNRIQFINKRLEKVRQIRDQNRRARKKASLLTVSLVGYTNAGKSTLFNRLTGAEIYAADQLFATLDPTLRKLALPGSAGVIVTDTVGFIRELPHSLVEAFHATLEETKEADLLLHVIDVSDSHWRDQVTAVEQVLHEIGADTNPRIWVFNKIDKQPGWLPKIDYQEDQCRVWLSAQSGMGLDLLVDAITKKLHGLILEEEVEIEAHQAKVRAQLYAMKAVVMEEALANGGWKIRVRLSQAEKQKLFDRHNLQCQEPDF